MNHVVIHNLKAHVKIWSHPDDGIIFLHWESHPSVQSQSSQACVFLSPQYSWYASHNFFVQFSPLHVHSIWLSDHVIYGVPACQFAHNHGVLALNHGVVCFPHEKYVLHLSFVPHDAGVIVLHVFEHTEFAVPLFDQSSHCSPLLDWTVQSPQYFWYASHNFFVQFSPLHVHSIWLSDHVIYGVPACQFAHNHGVLALNHGVVCFPHEKYVLHLSFVPHDAGVIVLHVFEHTEFAVPLFDQSSHCSPLLDWTVQSPQYSWYAGHTSDTFQLLSHCHVYVGELVKCLWKFTTFHLSHNHGVLDVIQSSLIFKYVVFL